MLSILIPTYNYDVTLLVNSLLEQTKELKLVYEIIVLDDGSPNDLNEMIITLSNLENVKFIQANKNSGLASARNALGKASKYDWLLFLDADVIPKSSFFIKKYLKHISSENQIIYGGLAYQKNETKNSLRYKFGVKREAISAKNRVKHSKYHFHCSNTLIQKKLFLEVEFDSDITCYGHEDTLFQYNISQKKINILHIDNFVYHLGIDSNDIFLKKTKESLSTLLKLENEKKLPSNYTSVQKAYIFLRKINLDQLFFKSTNIFISSILKNLKSNTPSLLLFDIFKLNYFCSLKLKKRCLSSL